MTLYKDDGKGPMAGSMYVPAQERINPGHFIRLQIKTKGICDHTEFVCKTRDCIAGWHEGDWALMFERTAGGRYLLRIYQGLDELDPDRADPIYRVQPDPVSEAPPKEEE